MFASVTHVASRLPPLSTFLALALPILLVSRRVLRFRRRALKVPRTDERILILGASSGIGRAIAHEYAARNAHVCVVARREADLKKVVEECGALSSRGDAPAVFSVAADFTSVKDMVRVRERIEREWKGIDTVVVCAGVTALRPLMEVAGLERDGKKFSPPQADEEGIQRIVDVASTAAIINYTGPLVAAVTFIPLLQATSASPSILLISSMAALVPAPTRALYCSTKAASLMLYQALSIEHPSIRFSLAIPATVQGDFRSSAVDGGQVRELDPNKHGLRPEDVANKCVKAVDAGQKFVFLPYLYTRAGHLLYWLVPDYVEWRAGVKYNFTV